jgi:hypothetical protein
MRDRGLRAIRVDANRPITKQMRHCWTVTVSVEIPREKTGKKATGKCIDRPKKFD